MHSKTFLNAKDGYICQSSHKIWYPNQIVALPFPKREGEVGCEALSSRPHEHWQSNNIGADDAGTPPAGHAATASDEQSTDAKIFHIAIPACNIMAGCCEQFSISSGYQSIVQRNGPTTCNAASKRKARSEGPRPREISYQPFLPEGPT